MASGASVNSTTFMDFKPVYPIVLQLIVIMVSSKKLAPVPGCAVDR